MKQEHASWMSLDGCKANMPAVLVMCCLDLLYRYKCHLNARLPLKHEKHYRKCMWCVCLSLYISLLSPRSGSHGLVNWGDEACLLDEEARTWRPVCLSCLIDLHRLPRSLLTHDETDSTCATSSTVLLFQKSILLSILCCNDRQIHGTRSLPPG